MSAPGNSRVLTRGLCLWAGPAAPAGSDAARSPRVPREGKPRLGLRGPGPHLGGDRKPCRGSAPFRFGQN